MRFDASDVNVMVPHPAVCDASLCFVNLCQELARHPMASAAASDLSAGPAPTAAAPAESDQLGVAAANRSAALARRAAKTTPISHLNFDELMNEVIAAGDQGLRDIESWLQLSLPPQAAGVRCLVREPGEIRKIIQDSSQSKTVQSGGTLAMVALSRRAFPRVNTAKVLFVLKSWDCMPLSLGGLLGTVQINADVWSEDTMTDLTRASSDAEP
jgi:hypothetical protein